MALTQITAPAAEPLSLEEAKQHLREDGDGQDLLLQRLIVAVRSQAEHLTKRALVTQTWDWTLDRFKRSFEIPKPPLQSVEYIRYLDDGGNLQTVDESLYRVDAESEPGRVTLDFGQTWPTTYPVANAVILRFVAGYGDAAAVPADIKAAMLLQLGHFYEHREDEILGSITSSLRSGAAMLLGPHTIREV